MHGHTHPRHGAALPKRVAERDDGERASAAGKPGVAAQKYAVGGGRVVYQVAVRGRLGACATPLPPALLRAALKSVHRARAPDSPERNRGYTAEAGWLIFCSVVLCDIYIDIYVCVSLKWRLELLLATAGDREPLPLDWWCDLA